MPLVLKFAVAALLFAMGLNSSPGLLGYLWRRPALLVRSLLAMYLVVPLFAIALVSALDLPRGTEVAIVVLAVCAGAPLLPRRLMNLGGDPAYVLSLAVTTAFLAIVTVPVSVKALARWLGVNVETGAAEVAWAILKSFLLPFGAGMLVRALAPRHAARAADPLMTVAGAALVVGSVVVLVAAWRLLAALGIGSFLAFAAFALGSLAIGHALGGPAPQDRTSLAVACTTRHIGLALLVGANIRGPRALSLVAGYLLATTVVCLPYMRWRRSAHALPRPAD